VYTVEDKIAYISEIPYIKGEICEGIIKHIKQEYIDGHKVDTWYTCAKYVDDFTEWIPCKNIVCLLKEN